jgi:hypothetical protein
MKINSQYELKNGALIKIAEEVPYPQGSNLGTSSLPVTTEPKPAPAMETEAKPAVTTTTTPSGEPLDEWSQMLTEMEAEEAAQQQAAQGKPAQSTPVQGAPLIKDEKTPEPALATAPEKPEVTNATEPPKEGQI